MDKILPWFALKSVPGIGNILFKRLIDRFSKPEAVFEASDGELLQINGITKRLIFALRHHQVPEWVKRDLDLADRKGYCIIKQSDPDYPPLLLQIPDPPPIFFLLGRLDPERLHIAVVGSRHATQYGTTAAKQISQALASRNVTIVSGMARGIDSAAHSGAIAAMGTTIAVLGSGLEKIYPPENKTLFKRIAEQGAIISEFPLLADPEPHHFPIRNRIISGISHGTVVVEASQKSGSLITARLAAEQNREVFAVPGNINSRRSTGTHALIKQGAKLTENADDILEEFGFILNTFDKTGQSATGSIEPDDFSEEERQLLTNLEPYPIHMDELVRKSKIEAGKLSAVLLQLEIKGIVIQIKGNYFQLIKDMPQSRPNKR